MTDKPSICLLAVIIPILSLLSFSQASPQTLEERVDRYIASFPKHEEFQGVILAAAQNKIYLHKGYGLASREYNIPNNPDTKFQVGSISKAFTAILVLKMVEKGLIDLDATISDYLPYYSEETGRKISIHHLLSHSSGIPHHYIAVPDYWIRHDKVFHTPRELLQLFANIPLAHEPGKQFTYSSPGFYILGAILEQVSKKSYAELLQEYIFTPLGMKDSRVENNRTVQEHMATGYMRGLTGLVRAGFEDKSTALAAGDLVTTAYDLYLWDKGMKDRSDKILRAESKKLLYKTIFPGQMFTYGGPVFRIPYDKGQRTLTINRLSGSSTGYTAAMDRCFEPDACVIVLSNVQDAETTRILDHVSDFLMRHYLGVQVGNPAPSTLTPSSAAEVSPADAQKILGFYGNPDGAISGVIRDGGKLYQLRYSKGGFAERAFRLVPESPGVYNLGYLTAFKCRFSLDEKDGTLSLTTLRNGRALSVAKKIEAQDIDVSEYTGHYTSVELQRTFSFSLTPSGLTAEKFLGNKSVRMIPLEKDLFGFDQGFLEFTRYPDGTISGFKLVTKDVDTYFGSKFIKL
jgi:CubicO group peptidase (beta-lactamase class C family)